jgi:N-acetylglutamate synthase-like GNAT family acetyltransferase
VQIRRAARQDLPGLAVLLAQLGYPAGPEEIERRLERLDGELFVAADGELLGLAGLQVMHVLRVSRPRA